MNLLALDLGIHTGWAAAGAEWIEGIESGVQEFPLARGESPGMRYLRFRSWLEEMVELTEPTVIVYEQAYLMPTAHASEIFFGFTTRIQEVCAQHKIEHTAYNAQRLKKWTTGGVKVLGHRAGKQDMIEACCKRWKTVRDDNEADAIALLHYAKEQMP